MPIVFTLRLRPFRPWQPDTAQLHGLACALFEGPGIDHNGQDKPFATWPMEPDLADPHVGLLRCSWLRDGPPPRDVGAMPTVLLGDVTCELIGVDPRQVPHANLTKGSPATTATVTFRSPTYFSHNGEDLVDPDPGRIVGSWLRQWNQGLPDGSTLRIGDDLGRQLRRAGRFGPYNLCTAEMDSGHGFCRLGFVGAATLRLKGSTPLPVRSAFATLVRFASYCGTGAQTTHGFGATTTTFGASLDAA